MGGKLLTNRKSRNELSIGTQIGDLERCNAPYFALFHRLRARCRRKTIIRPISVSKSTYEVMIVYNHINAICAIIQRLFGQNKIRQWPLLQTVVA